MVEEIQKSGQLSKRLHACKKKRHVIRPVHVGFRRRQVYKKRLRRPGKAAGTIDSGKDAGMKVYISGPITGRPKQEYLRHFIRAEADLSAAKLKAVNPATINSFFPDEVMSHSDYMKVSIAALSICDGIYMLEGWQQSKGSLEEFNYAVRNKKFVLFEGMKFNEEKNPNRIQ